MPMTVGILGVGPDTDLHLAAYVENPDVNDVLLAEPCDAARQQIVDKWGIVKAAYADFQSVIDTPGVSLVDICAPYPRHRGLAMMAFEAGKDVILSAPPAQSVAECDDMMTAATESGRRLFCCLDGLFAPYQAEAEKVINQGGIGKLQTAQAYIAGAPGYGDIVFTWGYRAIYMLERLVGPAMAVSCMLPAQRADDERQAAAMTLQTRGGTVATVVAEFCTNAGKYELRVTGSDGFLIARDDPEDEIPLLVGHDESVSVPRVPCPLDFRSWSVTRALNHLVECVLRDTSPVITMQQARSALCVAQAALASARTLQTVLIENR